MEERFKMQALLTVSIAVSVCVLGGCDAGAEGSGGQEEASSGQGEAGGVGPCPGCSPNPGGESSDIGGSLDACVLFLMRNVVDEQEAIALGFDVTTIRERAERPIESALRWLPQETEAGEPAQGYEEETSLRASITVRSYVYERPDPEACDGVVCRGDDGSGRDIETEDSCGEALFVGADVSIETLDGAISAVSLDDPEITGTDSITLMIKDRQEKLPHGTISIDLTEVDGSLRLFPHVPEPYMGTLSVSFDFAPEETRGSLRVKVFPDWAAHDEGIPPELTSYKPLRGEWPASGE